MLLVSTSSLVTCSQPHLLARRMTREPMHYHPDDVFEAFFGGTYMSVSTAPLLGT